jgi:hypothetical protein
VGAGQVAEINPEYILLLHYSGNFRAGRSGTKLVKKSRSQAAVETVWQFQTFSNVIARVLVKQPIIG